MLTSLLSALFKKFIKKNFIMEMQIIGLIVHFAQVLLLRGFCPQV